MKDEKGRFLPGNAGRPKGAANKVTTNLRANVQKLLEDNFEQVAADLKKLDPKSRADVWLRLLEYSLPKLTRAEISEAPTDLEILMQLTPEERQSRIIELQSRIQTNKSA